MAVALEGAELKLNLKKTEVMSSIAKDGDVVEVNGTAFTGVKDSQYFGGFLSADGTVRKRINCTGLKWRESTGKKSTSL